MAGDIRELISIVDDTGYASEGELNTRKMVSDMNRKKKKSGGFQSMGLSHAVYKGIIRKGYKVPTPIQRKCIPLIMENRDVVAMARTGSGKTAAFLLPMFEKLQTRQTMMGARALLLSPTRELALQTMKFVKELGKFTQLKTISILGGDRMDDQFAAIHENPDIIIATPGRLMHVLLEMEHRLSCVQYVVFDEADRLFELGFDDQLREILKRLPEDRQTLLFSATLPKQLVEFAKAGLNDPTLVRLDVDNKLSDQLKLAFFHTRFEDKLPVLLHLLRNVFKETEQSVVFVATKHHVEYVKEVLMLCGMNCSYVYSSLDQTARKINISKFRNKKTMILVVTDVAARGLDIPMLDNVVNYSVPSKPKLFVHRVGRVARAGRIGSAYSIVSPDELPFVIDLHLFLGRAVEFVKSDQKYQAWDSLYGLVAQLAIDEERATLGTILQNSEVVALSKVSENAYKQYLRSRPAAASESIKRAKEILISTKIGIHPLFENMVDTSETARLELLSSMKNYKPNSTIFEIGATTKSTGAVLMKKARKRNQKFFEKHQEKLKVLEAETCATSRTPHDVDSVEASLIDDDINSTFSTVVHSKPSQKLFQQPRKSKKQRRNATFRDDQFYINYMPKDYHTESGLAMKPERSNFAQEASSFSLDLMGDEDVQLRKQKTQRKVWDRKRKRFVNAQDAGPVKKKMRTESGALISSTYKKNFYAEWKKKSKIDEKDLDDQPQQRDDWRGGKCRNPKFANRGKKEAGGGKKVRSELKRPEQVLKARKQKQAKGRKQQKQNSKSRRR